MATEIPQFITQRGLSLRDLHRLLCRGRRQPLVILVQIRLANDRRQGVEVTALGKGAQPPRSVPQLLRARPENQTPVRLLPLAEELDGRLAA